MCAMTMEHVRSEQRVLDQGLRSGRPGVPADRALHLVDMENLCGGSGMSDLSAQQQMHEYERLANIAPTDHVVIGCGPTAARRFFALEAYHPQFRIGHGLDGADRALLEWDQAEHIAARYDRVYVASGDHIFASFVAELRLRGCEVVVVSRREGLSARLGAVATRVIFLPDPPSMASAS